MIKDWFWFERSIIVKTLVYFNNLSNIKIYLSNYCGFERLGTQPTIIGQIKCYQIK